MIDRFDRRLREDRMVRDSALALIKADIEQVKHDYSAKTVGARLAGRITEGAHDVLEQASHSARDQRGVLFVLVAAVGLWFARNPVLSLLDNIFSGTERDDPENTQSDPSEPAHPANAPDAPNATPMETDP